MDFVLGLDSGGTHTRVAAVDLTGNVLGYIEGKPGNPEQNPEFIAISGTGWSVYAVTETDRRLHSGNLAHFSGGGAWHLSCGAIHAMIGTGYLPDHQEFIDRVCTER